MSRTDLNQGPVARQIFRVSAPMSVGIFSVLAIGLADAFFLARAGDAALAAVGFVYPVIVAVSAFSVGLAAGANAALSQARGAGGSEKSVGRLALHAAMLGLGIGLTLGGAFWLLSPWLFELLGARDAVLDNILAYLDFWIASFPLLVLTMVLNSAFRAAGDGLTAASVMVATALLNIALTPVLIFGFGPVPGMGMAGAGLGTLLARAAALALVIALSLHRGMVVIGAQPLAGAVQSVRDVLQLGLPAALSRGINPAGMAAVTAAVATLGDTAVAGFGAASRVQAIALVPFFGLAAGLGPVVGQAWGAGEARRARAAMRTGTVFALLYGGCVAALLIGLAGPISRAMTAEGNATSYTADYLRFVGWSLAGYGVLVAVNAALTGRSRAGWAMGLSLGRICLVYIPLAWLGVTAFGYPGVLAAAVAANLTALWGASVTARANGLGGIDARIVRAPAERLGALAGREPGRAAGR